jgi:hypothetical protein
MGDDKIHRSFPDYSRLHGDAPDAPAAPNEPTDRGQRPPPTRTGPSVDDLQRYHGLPPASQPRRRRP